MTRSRCLGALAGVLALAAAPSAQPFATPSQEAPVAVTDLARRGAGGVVAAMPTLDSPFFSNPSHIASGGFVLNVVGVSAGVGGNVMESYDFYNDELGPAIEEGLDEMRQSDPERLAALYAEALRIGGQPKTADLAVLAPSVRLGVGPASFGIGLFGHSMTRAQITDGGAGIPFVDLYSQADIAVPLVVGTDVSALPVGAGLPFGLQVGARMTYLQRRVTSKAKPIDAIDPDREKLFVLRGSTVRMSVGALASDVGVAGLDVGLDVSNLGGSIDYAFETAVDVSSDDRFLDNDSSALTAAERADADALEARFDAREASPVVRAGLAYRISTATVPGVSDASVGLDYTSASTSSLDAFNGSPAVIDQSMPSGLRLGGRVTVGGVLELQAGISQGMPSAGVALGSRLARLEYATYGVEDGRLLGQLQRRNHVVRLRLGWF